MFYDGGYTMIGMHWLWWFFWIILLGVLLFYGWGSPSQSRRGPRETPHQVLSRRLANGEITPQQYEERKALLDRDSAGKP